MAYNASFTHFTLEVDS